MFETNVISSSKLSFRFASILLVSPLPITGSGSTPRLFLLLKALLCLLVRGASDGSGPEYEVILISVILNSVKSDEVILYLVFPKSSYVDTPAIGKNSAFFLEFLLIRTGVPLPPILNFTSYIFSSL